MPRTTWRRGLLLAAMALQFAAAGTTFAETARDCRKLEDAAERLACYDRVTATERSREEPPVQPGTGLRRPLLSDIWEISSDQTRRVLKIRSHHVNYFLPVRYSTSPGAVAHSPTLGDTAIDPVASNEAKFQISIKTRILQGLLDDRLDVWLGYTQQAHWQVYSNSAPFREVNFEPEIMALWRVNRELSWMTWRFVNFGLVHQSNGKGGPLSRSWNRVYAQFGFERGDRYGLLVRPWWRIPEAASTDNNPDMSSYYGRMDVTGLVRLEDNAFEVVLRNNLSVRDNRGAITLSWFFPMYKGLKGYLQLFNGYGESLIDYNRSQTTLGLGFAVVDWM
ncbi:MAG: phospholipase [Betaproteobacteria bacterium]|nr:phospholipase [Betaproteobacteria bacterium]